MILTPNALGPVVLIPKHFWVTFECKKSFDHFIIVFSLQKCETIFKFLQSNSLKKKFEKTLKKHKEKKIQIVKIWKHFGNHTLKSCHFWWSSVRPSSILVFKNFCSFPSSQFPSAVVRAAFGLPGSAAFGSLAALGIKIWEILLLNSSNFYTYFNF